MSTIAPDPSSSLRGAEAPSSPSTLLPLLDGPPVPEVISLQAVEWLVLLQSPEVTPAVREAFARWRVEHADHERAWRHIESFGSQLRDLNAPLAHGALVHSGRGARQQRRQALKLLGMAALTGGGLWLARDGLWQEWREWHADQRTAVGQRHAVVLADASRIELDTASAIDVRFDGGQRLVRLLAGQVLISTAPDPALEAGGAARPFLVETAEGRLRALGTRFMVRQQAGSTLLAVFEGAVEVRPAQALGSTRIVPAGEQARIGRASVDRPTAVDEHVAAWARGMLVARDMPLGDFIAELARYRPGHLGYDPRVGDLRVSGIYPLDDTDRVIDMLVRTQPVQAHRMTRYWVTIRPRGG